MQPLRSFVLAGALLALPGFSWAQPALTCTVTTTPAGVCVAGVVMDAAEPVTVTLARDVLCISRTPWGSSSRRQASSTSTQTVQASRGTATFALCVSGTLTPPCPETATVNVDALTLTTDPDLPGCVLPTD
jgi:hypothetical protein